MDGVARIVTMAKSTHRAGLHHLFEFAGRRWVMPTAQRVGIPRRSERIWRERIGVVGRDGAKRRAERRMNDAIDDRRSNRGNGSFCFALVEVGNANVRAAIREA